jgi:hypothetical protein
MGEKQNRDMEIAVEDSRRARSVVQLTFKMVAKQASKKWVVLNQSLSSAVETTMLRWTLIAAPCAEMTPGALTGFVR